jgi:hypothetical protein
MRILVAACAAMMLAACSTIINGSTQEVAINSDPADASIRITNLHGDVVYEGKTPATVLLKRGNGYFAGAEYKVEFTKPGYKTATARIDHELGRGWYLFGNVGFGFLIGWVVIDPVSGAMWNLTPETYTAKLSSDKAALGNPSDETSLRIVLLKDVPEALRGDLVRIN